MQENIQPIKTFKTNYEILSYRNELFSVDSMQGTTEFLSSQSRDLQRWLIKSVTQNAKKEITFNQNHRWLNAVVRRNN